MQFRINNRRPSPLEAIGGLVILAVFIVGMFLLARFIFRILAWLSPLLLILALILDYRTVTGYLKWVWEQVRGNALTGILIIALSILGFPLLAAFLAGKAAIMRSVRRAREEKEKQKQGEFAEYETLDSETLELPDDPDRRRRERARESSSRDRRYDQFFED